MNKKCVCSPVKQIRREKKTPARENTPALFPGVVIGLLAGMEGSGIPLVDFPGNSQGLLPALTTVSLSEQEVGREVVLQFENGDPARPIILGLLQQTVSKTCSHGKPVTAKVDGERLTIAAAEEIVLQCGKASITLTRDGKVAIRGTYLLSRSTGVNRLQGGSIQLN